MDTLTKEYKDWINELKSKVRSAQLKTVIVVNSAFISFDWELGKIISKKTALSNWGDKILEQVSKDLKGEFLDMKGLSRSNLSYAKQFFEFYESSIVQQAVGRLQISNQHSQLMQHPVSQVPRGHNILIFSKSNDINEAHFYIQQTIENGWSREVLALQVKSKEIGTDLGLFEKLNN